MFSINKSDFRFVCGEYGFERWVGWGILTVVWACFALVASSSFGDENGPPVTFEKLDGGDISIRTGGRLFAQYRPNVSSTPILWPILSPDGQLMARSLPMIARIDVEGESDAELKNIYRNAQRGVLAENNDHPHHRSLWFDHGDVNGFDFWALGKGTTIRPVQVDVRSELVGEVPAVVIHTVNKWCEDGSDAPLLGETRRYTFGVDSDDPTIWLIDCDIELTAECDEVVFGDTKEGTFGYRTPGTMDVDARKRFEKWGGHIVNAQGQTDGDTWAKRSAWVDYSGPVPKRLTDEQLDAAEPATAENLALVSAGVTIMNHPESFRYPSWYHVRTYGLFAVNPFGVHDFEPNSALVEPVTLRRGEKLLFRYRVAIYDGSRSAESIQKLFDRYAASR